jgi:hypothetical protein
MTDQLKAQDFTPHLKKVFHVEGGAHALTLTHVEERRLEEFESEMALREPFNLIFRGPPGNVLPAGLYRLAVEDGPSFELYVMPVHTPMRDRQNYQAPFN